MAPTYDCFRMFRDGKKIKPEILSLDKAYASQTIINYLERRGIKYQIPNKKNAKVKRKISKLKPFRWVVERSIAWLNAFRAVRTCWEIKEENYNALCQLASSVILFRMARQ